MSEPASLDEEVGDDLDFVDMNRNVYDHSLDEKQIIPPKIIVTNEDGRKVIDRKNSLKKGIF